MHDMDRDDEMKHWMQQVEIPPHRPDLPERIITAAMVSGQAPHATPHGAYSKGSAPLPQLRSGAGFSHWWSGMRSRHGQKMAVAAALAAIAIIVFDPAGHVTKRYIASQQLADAERYTINGLPLLADVELVDEVDFQLSYANF